MQLISASKIAQLFLAVSSFLLLIACGAAVGTETRETPPEPIPTQAAKSNGGESQIISWIRDDYSTARQRALESNVPIVIDMWAQWCHSCLSMTHFVLNDQRMSGYKDRFVWLAIDTDREANAGVLEKYEVTTWPTFMLIDPETESILAVQIGTATVEEFSDFLLQGEKRFVSKNAPNAAEWLVALQAGDTSFMRRDYATAAVHYRSSLTSVPKNDANRSRIAISLMRSLAGAQQWRACTDIALAEWSSIPLGSPTESFAYYAHRCAEQLAENDPDRLRIDQRAVALLQQLLADPPPSMPVDDRAGAMATLRTILDAIDSHDAAMVVARQQKELLDRAAAEAGDPYQASTYNYPRYEVYSYLGIPGELIDELKLQVEALPEQFDPPYRVAQLYLKVNDLDQALVYARRAAELSYGPRQCRIRALIAEIHRSMGNREGEAAALRKTIEQCEALPDAQKDQRIEKLVAQQRELLARLPTAAP